MPLKKPPLVEIWLSFRFEPAAGAPPWTREQYQIFLEKIADTHPNAQEMTRQAIRVTTSKHGGKPQIKDVVEQVLAMRALTENGLRAVQLTPNELTVNYLRGDTEPYPGFAALLEEALAHCRGYAELYRPIGITEAALHYLDMLEIPIPKSGILRSEEYLTLNLQVPEDVFGTFAAFEIKAAVKPPDAPGFVELAFATEPAREDDTHRRFRLEWHTAVRTNSIMAEEAVRANLQTAHDCLEKCFRQAFTPRGWALFEPEES